MPNGSVGSKNILIFYISQFSGHYQAAKAIEAGLDKVLDRPHIRTINALTYTNPILGSLINRAYIEVIKKKPEFWGNIYDNPDVLKKTQKARDRLNRFNEGKMQGLLDEYGPDIVYCTQAFPCGMVANYKRSTGKDIPLVAVLTDHAPHSYWLHDEVDVYVVPSKEAGDKLIEKGVEAGKIRDYGIPVDPKFGEPSDREDARSDLGFEGPDPVILVMGGSQGLGAMEDAVKNLLRDEEHNYRLIVVAGSNKRLFSKLNRLDKKTGKDNMLVLSFVDNIEFLMDASDLIVTKAGGMTISESIVKGLPMVIVKPIPGQEKMNADHLVANGAAVEIEDEDNIYEAVNRIFSSRGELAEMRKNVTTLARPESAIDIARIALEARP